MTYERIGECNQCGLCCLIDFRGFEIKTESVIEKDDEYFKLLREGWKIVRTTKTMIYVGRWSPCPYLNFDMTCSIHETDAQPEACRDFPFKPEGYYQLVKDRCTFRFKRVRRKDDE